MRIHFKKSDLVEAAAVAQSVASPQSTVAILSHILIKGEHENLATLTATDFDTRVRVEVPAEVSAKGSVTVPARTFYDLVKELPEDADIIVEANGRGVEVRCRDIRCELAAMPADDFPLWPEMEPKLSFEMPQKQMKSVLDRVLFAIALRDPRKALQGALFEIRKNNLTVVSTDGKILACIKNEIAVEKPPKEFSAIVPRKLLDELDRNLNDEGTVAVALNDKQVAFRLSSIEYLSNQIEGKYPDYEVVIPKQFARKFRIQKPPLLAAIRRAAIFTDQKQNSILFHFKGDKLELSAETYDRGKFVEELPAVQEGGDEFKIGFNYRFLLDVLKVLDAEEILLQANQSHLPAVVQVEDRRDCLYVIMPIRLPDPVTVSATGGDADDEEEESEK